MKKLFFILSILMATMTASSQYFLTPIENPRWFTDWVKFSDTIFIYNTDTNFRVLPAGNIDRIRAVPYLWPGANGSGVLTNDGSGNLSWSAGGGGSVDAGDITGLTEDEFVFGASDGSATSSSFVKWSDVLFGGLGAGVDIHNTNPAATMPSSSILRIKSDEAYSFITFESDIQSGFRFYNTDGSSTKWFIYHQQSDNSLHFNNVGEDGPWIANGTYFSFTENQADENKFTFNGTGLHLTNNDNPIILTFDQNGTEYTITNNGTVMEIDAPETILTGELGIGETTSPAFDIDINADGRVEVVGTGYGTSKTVFGARFANGTFASPTAVTSGQDIGEFGMAGYKATTFTTSSVAHIKATSTENWTDAATGAKLTIGTTPNGTTGTVTAITVNHDQTVDFSSDVTVSGDFVSANVYSGTYTPTITSIGNLDATSSAQCQFMRVGNVVTVSGVIEIDPTTSGLTEFRIDLPISSDITSITNLSGQAIVTAATTRYSLQCKGDTTNDAAYFIGYTTFNANNETSIMFQYLIQ